MSAPVGVLAVLDARIALNLERGTKGGGYMKGSSRHREDLAVRDAVSKLFAADREYDDAAENMRATDKGDVGAFEKATARWVNAQIRRQDALDACGVKS